MTPRRGSGQGLRVLLARVAGLFRGGRRDERLREEISHHLESLTAEYVRRGMPAAEARVAALRCFGSVANLTSDYSRQRGIPGVDALIQDVRFACRILLRDRGFAATATLVLGLGIGVNNMMFTLIYAATLRGLPIRDPGRVVHISTVDQRFPDRPLSFPEFEDVSGGTSTLSSAAAFLSAPVAVGDEGRGADRFDATYLSAHAFDLVGTSPLLGRMFSADEDQPGREFLVVLGHRAWWTRYRADPGIIGQRILVDGSPGNGHRRDAAALWLPNHG